MWEIAVSLQAEAFLWSIILGAWLCFLYDILRAERIIFKSSFIFIAIGDIFYFFFASVLTFLFLLIFCCGQVRLFVLSGEIIGFIVFRLILSGLWLRLLIPVFKILHSAITALRRISERFELYFKVKTDEIIVFFKKSLKKRPKVKKTLEKQ